ncbi:type IV pilus modification protein PilV [Pseudomonas sp. J452]|uniref:type IV pilus modification protein PilV n=1 Tax=Pseudomonas sp. J452 TaxID=2898441 RepID=UPI0021ADE9A6|nr:type IV pilus modification protein PilV [Pseudomonas sp. J452]UUY10143.1 type IV pilus modification protein PilV [Pseudomonas sp. J452]
MPISARKQRGFSIIEVLFALLILAIGLFGMASLMMTSMKSNQSAAVRSQATWLAYDIIERMRLNAATATNGNYDIAAADTADDVDDPGCKDTGCTATATAQLDLWEWKTQLEQAGLSGAIQQTGNTLTVTITWQDLNTWRDPKTSDLNTCNEDDVEGQCSYILSATL